MAQSQDRLIHWLLDSLELQTTLFHLGRYCGSWQTSTSGLADASFHVVLAGDCWLHLPQSNARLPLRAGDAVFFLRDVPHLLSPHADVREAAQAPRRPMRPVGGDSDEGSALACGFFAFRTPLREHFLGPFPDHVLIARDDDSLRESRPIFDLILAEARQEGNEPSPLTARLVDLLFFYAIRHLCLGQEVACGLWAVLARREFASLLAAILDDPAHDWTIERMAGFNHMSRANFHKHFSQVAGTSPGNFLTRVRMTLAGQWIGRGMSLSRAAEKVGYQSDAAFSRAFKKVTGRLPGSLCRASNN
ncbi:MAG: AraC family transcriptional regulator [Betaproteobacteria bacterium]|nr:AraC family transcriptional regulator [Betaproteobacteria bacterium]